jgi:hypothetical protein
MTASSANFWRAVAKRDHRRAMAPFYLAGNIPEGAEGRTNRYRFIERVHNQILADRAYQECGAALLKLSRQHEARRIRSKMGRLFSDPDYDKKSRVLSRRLGRLAHALIFPPRYQPAPPLLIDKL